MATSKEQYVCVKCGRSLRGTEFFTYKNGSKHKMCKKCLTMHIDNFDPETFLWILKDLDVPFLEDEWNILRDKAYEKDPLTFNGASVIGKYISKMKLVQWKDKGWDYTEKYKEEREKKRREAEAHLAQLREEVKQQFENGEISEAEYRTLTAVPELHKEYESKYTALDVANAMVGGQDVVGKDNAYRSENFLNEDELDNATEDLSKDDKIYLAMKWGRLYTPAQWVSLEKLYRDFTEAFSVYDPARLDTLKKICKTSLKMDEAIDVGDVDGYQKLSRVYDALMKSGKFTEAQKKDDKTKSFDCVGVIVRFCESKKGGGKIPRHKITTPIDVVDETSSKLAEYNKTLFYNDPTIKQLVENYVKKRTAAAEMVQDEKDAKAKGQDGYQLTDKDIIELKEAEERMREQDKKLYYENKEGDK